MNWKGLYTQLLMLVASVFLVRCSLDDPEFTDTTPALTLTSSQNHSLIVLNWEKVKVTGFKEYIILQSSTDIPNKPSPVINQNTTVLRRIDDVDITSLEVSPTLFSPNVCYKLYCDVGDRFLYSSTLCIPQDFDIIPGFYDRACHAPGIDELVMFDRINGHLSTYNYKTGLITNKVNDIVLSFPSLQMSTWNNMTNVFGVDQSPGWLRRYNYPSLISTHSKSYNQVLWAASVYSQFVFVGSQESGKGFQVLNRSNFNILDTRPGFTGNQNIAVFPGDPLIVITVGESESIRYTIDDNGKVMEGQSIPLSELQPDLQSSCALGSTLFISGRLGTIINRDGEALASLITGVNSMVSMIRFSPDETKVAYLLNDNGILRIEAADISNLPIVTKLKQYDIPALNIADMFIEDGLIYLIGATFNSGSQSETFILKYPI